VNKADIRIVTYLDALYPKNLLNIYDRPAFLFVAGRLEKMMSLLPLSVQGMPAPTADIQRTESAGSLRFEV